MAKVFQQCFSAVSSLVSKVFCVKKAPIEKKLAIIEQKIKLCEGELHEQSALMKTKIDRLLFYGFGIYFLIIIQVLGGRQLYILMWLVLAVLPVLILWLAHVVYVEYRKQISTTENQLLKLYAKKRLLMAEARKISDGITWKSVLTKYDSGCFYRRAQLVLNSPTQCSICHDNMDGKSMVSLFCGHIYHEVCITIWLREASTCPICCVHTKRFQEMGCFCPSQDVRGLVLQLYFVGSHINDESGSTIIDQRNQNNQLNCENAAHCHICHSIMRDGELASLFCGHVYHSACLELWLVNNTSCPICTTGIHQSVFFPYILRSLGLSTFLHHRHNFIKLYLS